LKDNGKSLSDFKLKFERFIQKHQLSIGTEKITLNEIIYRLEDKYGLDIQFDKNGELKIITKPETTDNYHRIPVNSGCKITATITISAKEGIKALYCGEEKKVHTYLFDVNKWTMEEAKKWVADHKDYRAEEEKTVGELTDEIMDHAEQFKTGEGNIAVTPEMFKSMTEDILTMRTDLTELKEGRVLSSKNRTLVKDIMDELTKLRDMLEELYTATEPSAREEEGGEVEIEKLVEVRKSDDSPSLDERIARAFERLLVDDKLGPMLNKAVDEALNVSIRKKLGKTE